MIVRLVLWNLADSKTTIHELRRHLRDESVDAFEELPGPRLADGRRLHEPVTGEAADGIDPLRDRADDRMRVGGHVVEARPRVGDLRVAGGRVPVAKPHEPIVENRLVHRLLEPPARL